MATIRHFEDLQAWQKARELVRAVYQICSRSGLSKDFGLKDQLCRAAVAAMSNVAEGFARTSDRDFSHFLNIAKASAIEVQSLLYVALDVGCIHHDEFEKLYKLGDETVALIGGFSAYLRKHPTTRTARLSDS
jgi:four helix bundle protein